MLDHSQRPTTFGGFVDAQTAAALERRRRQLRLIAGLGATVWTLVSIGVTNNAGIEGLGAFTIWVTGLVVIGVVAVDQWRRSGQALSATVVVDEHGRQIGRADHVGREIVQERAVPALAGFAVFHWVSRIEYVAGLEGTTRTVVTLTAAMIGVIVAWRLQRAARPAAE